MFANLQELEDRVHGMIANERAGRGLDRAIISDGCRTAVALVSRLIPLKTSDTFSGDGSAVSFALSGLSPAWVAGLSVIESVEYPAGEQEPTYLDQSEWMHYPSLEGATHLRFVSKTPESDTDNIRVVYTSVHTVDDTSSTWPDHLEPGIEHASAAEAAAAYAAKYGHSTNSSIDADAVAYGGLSRTWLDLAAAWRATASTLLGVDITGAGGGGGGTTGATAGQAKLRWADIDIASPRLLYRSRSGR